MKEISLKVQSTAKTWRLGLSTSDSKKYFFHLETVKFILTNQLIVYCNAACGMSKKKAFDFNGKKIAEWIIINEFQKYDFRRPTILVFNLTKNIKGKVLTFIRKEIIPNSMT